MKNRDLWLPGYGGQNDDLDLKSWFKSSKQTHIDNNENKEKSLNEKTLFKSNKVKLYPTFKQKSILLEWMNLYNYVYNQAIYELNRLKFNGETKIPSYYELRTIVMNKININFTMMQRIKASKVPIHSLHEAINDVCKAYKSAFSNLRNKNIKYFRIRYKKLKPDYKCFTFSKGSFSKKYKTFASRAFNNEKIKGVPDEINHTCRLNYRDGEFNLFVPEEIKQESISKRDNFCGLDPGIRTFQTVYSNEKCLDIGIDVKETINPILKKIDKKDGYKSIKAQNKHKKKLRKKLKNKVDDLHWKTANYLTDNYNTIAIGKLSTNGIVSNSNNLPKSVKRTAYSLSHFTFRQRLQHVCNKKNVKYVEINEHMTSKTCTNCKEVNENLGKSKIFNCNKCKLKIDRDYCGARNILLKHLKLFK